MADNDICPVNDYYRENGLMDEATYFDMYRRSIEDGEGFRGEQAAIVDWFKPFTRVRDVSFDRDDLHIRWYGDGVERDEDGYYWITGRVDDVLNVSGHRIGTAEVESAMVAHDAVAEAAVVGYPHDIKGQGIYVYVTLMEGHSPSDQLMSDLKTWVRSEIGPIATPDLIQWAPGLPKTRSGKIMRRILRKIAENDYGSLGDTSTLAEPSVVEDLIEHRMNR